MVSVRSLTVAVLLVAGSAIGNDSAASSAAGGIGLTIGLQKIRVEYEFLNESDRDITTEVAFPVPEYGYNEGGYDAIDDFRLWVEGREVPYQTETKAFLNGSERTGILAKLGVDIATLGHIDDHDGLSRDAQRMSPADQAVLIRAGLIRDGFYPDWNVRKTYHWQQTFPAHKVLHVRHEYGPLAGFDFVYLDPALHGPGNLQLDFAETCVEAPLRRTILSAARNPNRKLTEGERFPRRWVDYILTTANSWKRPIKQFELFIERPKAAEGFRWFVSLCWDGKIQQVDADHFVSRLTNFVPAKELRVMFFQLPT